MATKDGARMARFRKGCPRRWALVVLPLYLLISLVLGPIAFLIEWLKSLPRILENLVGDVFSGREWTIVGNFFSGLWEILRALVFGDSGFPTEDKDGLEETKAEGESREETE